MATIGGIMKRDHEWCDRLFVDMEEAVNHAHWTDAASLFAQFRAAVECHFVAEEQTLFPIIEGRMGGASGPTGVMRSEHMQMRELIGDMAVAVEGQEQGRFLGAAETLLIMIQQHNAKEEAILYPMGDKLLEGREQEVIGSLERAIASGAAGGCGGSGAAE